ncbi:MAG: zinc ribbon domain-containing protein [Clostridia bacterium]|nr:zinc ribbon domain-containing protein [Clostridia bacterium]
MRCRVCGGNIEDGVRFCGICGAETEDNGLKCQFCGAQLENGMSFCPDCGRTVGSGYPSQQAVPPVYTNVNMPAPKKTQNAGIVTAIIVLVLLLIAIAGTAVYMINEKSNEAEMHVTEIPIVEVPAPTPVATVRPTPVFTMARASSIRGTDTEGGQYSVDSVLSIDPLTKWVPSKASSGGYNEWVEVSANSTQYIQGIEILNGYHKSSDTWRNNNRVRVCTITFSNGETREFVLDDTMELIKLDLGEVVATTSIRLTIKSVYSGIKWDDTAITYLGAY